MEAIGYPATWRTRCFISGGCGKSVFAHTNGYGDFVLFDDLGWPWPVHECFSLRFLDKEYGDSQNLRIESGKMTSYGEAKDLNTKKPQRMRMRPADIKKISPSSYLGKNKISIVGYIQDHFKKQAEKEMKKMMALQRNEFVKILGSKLDQITIISSNLESYTTFIDLNNRVIKNKDIVAGTIRPKEIILSPEKKIFLCDELKIFSNGRK
jgi:hypothetical protein